MTILELNGISKSYTSGDDNLLILDSIDFTLAKGEFMSLTGESGCGKSTFLNLVGALDKADSGQIYSCGLNLSEAGESEMADYRNRSTGFIFQFHYLLKDFTALENIMLPGRISKQSRSRLEERAQYLLESVKLQDRGHHYPGQLSGGERQRIALARALINSPELILADEPTGSLDEKNSVLVEDMLFRLTEEEGVSTILVTHDRNLASRSPLKYQLKGGNLHLL
ncbi:MAG: ABC transporter ATP-binding protein [Spirochaetales bacterium]|nr:ABC transporter ATP-binding protein [Spirochaetales bacterium]